MQARWYWVGTSAPRLCSGARHESAPQPTLGVVFCFCFWLDGGPIWTLGFNGVHARGGGGADFCIRVAGGAASRL